MPASSATGAPSTLFAMTSIRPYSIQIDDDALADLAQRLANTRFPEAEPVDDWSQGIPLAEVQKLAEYWRDKYDWRARESGINKIPGFVTEIDGLDIHFLHARSSNPDALPIVMTHGWPGSVLEFRKIMPLLTEPQEHGGEAADAFHVICPAMPGYGFSDKPAETGWTVQRIGAAWAELMGRLGYDRYVAQGGDWGSAVTAALGALAPDGLIAVHSNMPIAPPTEESMADLTPAEMAALEAFGYYDEHDSGYSKQQSTRPQTLGYALADSPVGQMAWIVEKISQWTDKTRPVTDFFSYDEILDNVMFYWFTNAGTSSGRLYAESFGNFGEDPVQVPAGVSAFPNEILKTSKRWCEAGNYPNIVFWSDHERGGHFPAWEVPELLAADLRAMFRTYR